ncbi:MAG: MFS transporter, partial [Bacteroidaceae bacterium]|nr:MFS transporter [Bacteroidaceae bacterium]
GVPFLILSMLVYGVAFDFFNVSGSLYVNEMTDKSIRSSAQGLFVIVTNGFGATLGTLGAQYVVDAFTHDEMGFRVGDWPTVWFIFAGYSLVVAIAFAILFKYKHDPSKKQVPLS